MVMKMDYLSHFDLHEAYRNWTKYSAHGDKGKGFMQFLGITTFASVYSVSTDTDHIKLPEDAARKVRMLLSPHHLTIIKAWYVQHEQKQTEPDQA